MRDLNTKFHTIKWQVQKEHEITFGQAIEISVKTLLEVITPKVSGTGSMYDHYYFAKNTLGEYGLYLHEDSRGRGTDSQISIRCATPFESKALEVIEMLKSKGQ